MLRQPARLASFLFQPLLMPVYGTYILLHHGGWMSYAVFPALRNVLYIIVLSSTFLMPAIAFIFFLKRKQINTLEMANKSERNLPYISTLLFYIAGWYMLNQLPLPRIFSNIIMGASIAILFAFLINLRWKISIHMIGLGGAAGLLYSFASLYNFDLTGPLILIMIIAGITGTSRLILDAHIPSQIYSGFILGFVVEWLYVYINSIVPHLI